MNLFIDISFNHLNEDKAQQVAKLIRAMCVVIEGESIRTTTDVNDFQHHLKREYLQTIDNPAPYKKLNSPESWNCIAKMKG